MVALLGQFGVSPSRLSRQGCPTKRHPANKLIFGDRVGACCLVRCDLLGIVSEHHFVYLQGPIFIGVGNIWPPLLTFVYSCPGPIRMLIFMGLMISMIILVIRMIGLMGRHSSPSLRAHDLGAPWCLPPRPPLHPRPRPIRPEPGPVPPVMNHAPLV